MTIQYTIAGTRILIPAQTYVNAYGQQVTIPDTEIRYSYVSGPQIALSTEFSTIIDLFNRLPPSAALNMRARSFAEFHFTRYADYPGAAGAWNVWGWMDINLVDQGGNGDTHYF